MQEFIKHTGVKFAWLFLSLPRAADVTRTVAVFKRFLLKLLGVNLPSLLLQKSLLSPSALLLTYLSVSSVVCVNFERLLKSTRSQGVHVHTWTALLHNSGTCQVN